MALSTGGAYAANTIFSSDIVDGEVKTPDIASAAVTTTKLGAGAVGTDKLAGGAVTSDKVRDNTLGGRDVLDNALKGADIDESTLTNIGGGGPAGGDLTGSYPNPELAADAVTSAKVRDGSLFGTDIANFTLTGQKLATITTRELTAIVPPGQSRHRLPTCLPGEAVISGGLRWEGADDSFVNLWVLESFRTSIGGNRGWFSRGANPGVVSRTFIASVDCLTAG